MSLLNLLNIGSIGASAGQAGVNVAASNLSNVATEGYNRRSAAIRPELGLTQSSQRRIVEPYVERRLLNAQSSAGEAEAEGLTLQTLDIVFTDGAGSMGSALDAFQASMQELASRPNDMAVREQVLGNANNVATAFQNASAGLDQAHLDANERIRGGVDEVNQRLRQVGALSAQINKAEITGNEASDLRDRRDVLVREISERVPVTVVEQGSTGYSLTLNGSQSLVSPEGKVSELTVTDVSGDARITKMAAGVAVDVTGLVTSGTVGGSIKARDGALKEMRTKVDQLAFDFVNGYNQVHAAGVGLDSGTGRNVFVPPTGVAGAARNLTVSADVSGQPEKLAAATDVGSLPSDNRNALALSNLSSNRFATGGMTVSESLASMTARAGMAVQNANHAESFSKGALDQVMSLRDNMSGVNSDEEMVSMMRYQQAYSASLQVISVADQMLGELMNLRR